MSSFNKPENQSVEAQFRNGKAVSSKSPSRMPLFENAPAPYTFQNKFTSQDLVTISNVEYQHLLQASHHFTKLKDSLLNGGLSQETLDILIYGAPPPPNASQRENELYSGNRVAANVGSKAIVANGQEHSNNNCRVVGGFDEDDEDGLTDPRSDEKDDYGESSRSTGSSAAQGDQRTVLIRGLPDRVTHKEVVDTVRGGALLHIYLRARDRTASVSFVEEVAAQEFLEHTKTYGLYMAGKRVEVSWNDRQFYLPPFVRTKIHSGASRNLIIYNIQPNITEGLIRRDLEHIHNLIVISVKFKHGNAYVSTNSVHNALFARSCMMSRFTYKGMKISFYPDECRESLAKIPTGPKKELSVPAKKPVSAPNRFHLLSLDGNEDDESEDHHDGLTTNLNGSICWADNSVSA